MCPFIAYYVTDFKSVFIFCGLIFFVFVVLLPITLYVSFFIYFLFTYLHRCFTCFSAQLVAASTGDTRSIFSCCFGSDLPAVVESLFIGNMLGPPQD